MKQPPGELVTFPRITDPRGSLTFIEQGRCVPFEVRRTFWIYDVPGGEVHGGHAYRRLRECFIALSGSFDLVLDDGHDKRKVSLNRSYTGVVVPNMVWRSLENFSTNAVCLVLASEHYDEADYVRDYREFLTLAAQEGGAR